MKFTVHASGSSGNCYQVTSADSSVLIDPGISTKRIKTALNYQLSLNSAALVSHSHADHCKAVKDITKAGIDCYMSAETASALKITGHRICIIEPYKKFKIHGTRFDALAFPTHHDCPGSLGFLITDGADRLLYACDTFYCHNRFADLNIIAIECNYSIDTLAPDLEPIVRKRLYKSHFSLENVEKFLQANDLSKVREIHLIHMSNGNSDPKAFKQRIERLTGRPTFAHRP